MVFLARPDVTMETGTAAQPVQDAAPSRRRVLYAVGPGDVVGQYKDLQAGREAAFQMAMSFTRQFVDECDLTGQAALLISCHERPDATRVGPHGMENLPRLALYFAGGIRHHLGLALYGMRLLRRALRERPAAVIVDSGTTHWIMLAPLRLFRIPVIAVLHNALWPMDHPPQRTIDRLLRKTDGWFFRHVAAATVCVSPECERQVRLLAPRPHGAVLQCRAQYRTSFLSRVPAPAANRKPFHVLFLGRIEIDKGVFFLTDLAERLEQQMPGCFLWRIIGPGSASAELQRRIAARNLAALVRFQQPLRSEDEAIEALAWSHTMVVPTLSSFKEGLAMTAAESVLAGRPVVLSSVVPALELLGPAALRAQADDLDSFVEAFRQLALDASLYAACQRATADAQAPFYDRTQGLGAVLSRVLATLR